MNITLNNRVESFEQEKLSVADLIQLKNFTFKMLLVKVNKQLIQKDSYANTMLKDGDQVLILHMISGG